MTDDKTPDEQPKRKVAKRVVTEKRLYFVPEHNQSVEAADAEEAVDKAKKLADKQSGEEGDA